MRACLLLLGSWLFVGALFAQPSTPEPQPSAAKAHQKTEVRVLLVAEREALLSSAIAARITALPIPLGGTFKTGDVLAQFDCTEQNARLGIAEAEVASAHATMLAKRKLQAYHSTSELEVLVASAALAKAQAEVNLVRAQIRNCTVLAPFSGAVSRMRIRTFETIAPGQPILEIVDNSSLRFQLHVPSHFLSFLQIGSRFDVKIDETDHTYPARVLAIGGRIDPASRTIEILATIDGVFKELVAGMSGVAGFDGE